MAKIIKYIKNHKIITVIFSILLILFSVIFKVYKFNYKYKITENTSRIEVVVKEINSVSENKISYLVGYNR